MYYTTPQALSVVCPLGTVSVKAPCYTTYRLLLTKYARRWANLFKKNSEMFGRNSLGLDMLFATMSDPPTPNFQFLVQAGKAPELPFIS